LASALLQDVGEDAEVLVAVGVARPRRELQGAGGADDRRGFGLAEGLFRGGALQHGDGPVVAQAGLVVEEVEGGGGGLFEIRQAGADIVVQHCGVGEGVEHRRAGELLGDRADAEEGPGREFNTGLGIGPAPGAPRQHLALAQHGGRAAGSGIGKGQGLKRSIETGAHGRTGPLFAPGRR
jgi:hypothetical protein